MTAENRVKDGPSCRGCDPAKPTVIKRLPNYYGLCPVCRGDADEALRDLGEWSVRPFFNDVLDDQESEQP